VTRSFGPERRLHRKREYAAAFERGVTVRDGRLKIVAVVNGLGRTRLGTAVSRRAAREAVARNRIRRRIRECFRALYPLLPNGLDLVAVPIDAANEPAFKDLSASLLALAQRAEEKLARRAKAGGAGGGAAPQKDARGG
jgi:ribonuclease P protein component